MKSVNIIAVAALFALSGSALASSNSQGSNSSAQSPATGPWVECKLPNGTVEFIPTMICTIQKKGKVQ